jgi:CBS domain containing-hemolysin-like protein
MIDIILPLVIIVVLLLLNGLFVAAEFAIVGAPRTSIEHQASKGSALAKRVQIILENPKLQDRYIATTQVGISVASLGLGMYGEHVLAEMLVGWLGRWAENPWIAAHTIASILAVAILTYFHIVIGEMVPKALALQSADQTVLYVTPPVQAVQAA